MKSILGSLFLIGWFFHAVSLPAAVKIIIDPGHGGSDKGAFKWQLVESELTLQVSRALYSLLKRDPQFKPYLTRNRDQLVSLFDRAKTSRESQGELFISIHANSSVDSRARGAEFYIQNQLPPDEETLFLAYRENQDKSITQRQQNWPLNHIENYELYHEDVQNILQDLNRSFVIHSSARLAKSLYNNWQGVRKSKRYSIKQAPFYVVNNTNVPSILVEIGFITNKKEAERLKQGQYTEKIARGLYEGLVEYFQKKSVTP